MTTAKEMGMRMKTTIMTTLGIALLAAACGGGPADGSGASVVEDEPLEVEEVEEERLAAPDDDAEAEAVPDQEELDEEAESDEASADGSELGMGDNPLEIGTRFEMGA